MSMMNKIISIAREVEQLIHSTEVDPRISIKHIKYVNEARLLDEIKPFIKTQYFKRYNEDPGYLESRIWLPYVKDEVVKKLRCSLHFNTEYNNNLQKRIDKYNSLSWWRKLFIHV